MTRHNLQVLQNSPILRSMIPFVQKAMTGAARAKFKNIFLTETNRKI